MTRFSGAYRNRSRKYAEARDFDPDYLGPLGVQKGGPMVVQRSTDLRSLGGNRRYTAEERLDAMRSVVGVETHTSARERRKRVARTINSLIRAGAHESFIGRAVDAVGVLQRAFPETTEWVHPEGGWYECGSPCSSLPSVAYRSQLDAGSGCTACLTLQAIGELPPTQSQTLATVPQTFANRLDYYAHVSGTYPGATARFNVTRRYRRDTTGETTVHGYERTWPAQYVEPYAGDWFEAHPQFDPMRQPIGRYMPTPVPLPVRSLPALARARARLPRSTTETSSASYGQPPAVNPPVAVGHRWAPPGPGVKERKFVMAIDQGSPLGRAINLITEGLDVLDCFHKALPKHLRAKPKRLPASVGYAERRFGRRAPTPQAKAMAVYRHINHLDVGEALVCIVSENAEDTIFGRAGRHAGEAARRVGRSGPGFQVGPAL